MQAPAGFDFPLVAALTAFIALPVKFLVDVVKGLLPQINDGVTPAVGIAMGFFFCLVVLVANQTAITKAVLAQCGIAAVGAQVAAMAATWNQNRVQKVNERIDAALSLPPGSTRADVNNAVNGK